MLRPDLVRFLKNNIIYNY
uniref:Uncharacterized protein n=1 Tax=Triatoma infestans TaxID=30076 RepID=A0A161MEY7_TRIIF